MGSSSVVTPEALLESLMNDGTIDAIRSKIINQLKANVVAFEPFFHTYPQQFDRVCNLIPVTLEVACLGLTICCFSTTIIGVNDLEELKNSTISMVEQSKVLNTPGAEKQTKRELFDALRKELESQVLEKASKSVWELILDGDGLGREISETVERVYCRLGGRELPISPLVNGDAPPEKDKENPNSSLRKRSFSVMSMQGVDEVADKHSSTPAVPEDSGVVLLSNPKT